MPVSIFYLIYILCHRNHPSSTLPTLADYLDSVRAVLALILQIPPIDPSTSLRISYLLCLTADVLDAIPGYTFSSSGLPLHAFLQDVLDFLDDLDQSWMAVLQNQIWNPNRAEGVDLVITLDPNPASPADMQPYKSSPPSQTDVTRLRSMLFSGQSALEEWISLQKNTSDPVRDLDAGDVSIMFPRMGLLDQFDSLFVRTLDFLGGFSGEVARNVVNPEMEAEMV